MAAILQTTGPVSTHRACNTNWKFLRMLSMKQYLSACQELQKHELGQLVAVGNKQVFIKAHPSAVEEGLNKNSDVCTVEYYTLRYNMQPPSVISPTLKENLVTMGFVSPEQF